MKPKLKFPGEPEERETNLIFSGNYRLDDDIKQY